MYQQDHPGSYYGPPVPPQESNKGMRSFSCLRCLLWIIIAIGFILCLGALICWLVFRSSKVVVSVNTAYLTDFNLTSANVAIPYLSYNLTADITLRNPNSRVGINYDRLETASYYRSARFDWTPLPTFFQPRKTFTAMHLAAAGNTKMADYRNKDVEGYKNDAVNGNFNVDIWVAARVRYKFGFVYSKQKMLRVLCPLTITLSPRGSKAFPFFQRTECNIMKR